MVDVAAGYKSRDGMQFVIVLQILDYLCITVIYVISTQCKTTAPVQSSTTVAVNNYYEIIIHNGTKYESY